MITIIRLEIVVTMLNTAAASIPIPKVCNTYIICIVYIKLYFILRLILRIRLVYTYIQYNTMSHTINNNTYNIIIIIIILLELRCEVRSI